MKPAEWAIAAVVVFVAVYFAIMAADKAREEREKRELYQAFLDQQQAPGTIPTTTT